MNSAQRFARGLCAALLIAAGAIAAPAQAQVGLQRQSWTIAHPDGGIDTVPGMVFYPTAVPAQPFRMGPYEVQATPGAPPTSGRHPLVIISHGTGGHESGHAWLAQALAAEGYIVFSLRHPRDNFEDRSGVARANFFGERPAQLSRVLDQVLADPKWTALIDPQRIAAFGHSAGGHTVLAIAGGRPDRTRLSAHCRPGGAGAQKDAALCQLGPERMRSGQITAATPSDGQDLRDPRIRAVVAAAPMTMGLAPDSLKAVRIPVLLELSGRDEVLNPVFHTQRLCEQMPQARCQVSPDAGHFASFHPGTGRLGSAAGDPSEDPAGFDRRAWQAQAWTRIRDFLAAALR